MEVLQNRFLCVFSILIGPLVIAISQFFIQDRWVYPLIFVFIIVCLFFILFRRTPHVVYSSLKDGIIITGSKIGLYGPDFIAYSDIASVQKRKRTIALNLENNNIVELHIPKKAKEAVFLDINSKIKCI